MEPAGAVPSLTQPNTFSIMHVGPKQRAGAKPKIFKGSEFDISRDLQDFVIGFPEELKRLEKIRKFLFDPTCPPSSLLVKRVSQRTISHASHTTEPASLIVQARPRFFKCQLCRDQFTLYYKHLKNIVHKKNSQKNKQTQKLLRKIIEKQQQNYSNIKRIKTRRIRKTEKTEKSAKSGKSITQKYGKSDQKQSLVDHKPM